MDLSEQSCEYFVTAYIIDKRIQERAGNGDAGFFLTESYEKQSVVPAVIGKFHFVDGRIGRIFRNGIVCGRVFRGRVA